MSRGVQPLRRNTARVLTLLPFGVMAATFGLAVGGFIAPAIGGVIVLGAAIAHPVFDAIATLIAPKGSAAPKRRPHWKVVGSALYAAAVAALVHIGGRYFAPGSLSLPPIPPAVRIALGVGVVAVGVAVAAGALRGRRRQLSTRWTTAAGVLAGAAIVSLVAWPSAFRTGFPMELVVPLGTIALGVSAFGAYLVNHVATVGNPTRTSASASIIGSETPR